MSLHMINQINKYVKEDIYYFIVGLFFGVKNINLKTIKRQTIHHIINHDHHISIIN